MFCVSAARRRNLFYADLRSSTFEMDDKVFAWSLAPEIRRFVIHDFYIYNNNGHLIDCLFTIGA